MLLGSSVDFYLKILISDKRNFSVLSLIENLKWHD